MLGLSFNIARDAKAQHQIRLWGRLTYLTWLDQYIYPALGSPQMDLYLDDYLNRH